MVYGNGERVGGGGIVYIGKGREESILEAMEGSRIILVLG